MKEIIKISSIKKSIRDTDAVKHCQNSVNLIKTVQIVKRNICIKL